MNLSRLAPAACAVAFATAVAASTSVAHADSTGTEARIALVKRLIKILKDADLTEISYKDDQIDVTLKQGGAPVMLAPSMPSAQGAARAKGAATAPATADESRPVASNFKLKTLNGKTVELASLRGKVVVVNFWATWCVPCIQELPHLAKIYSAKKDEGLEILAITIDGPETIAKVRSTVKRKRFNMPILLDQEGAVSAVLNPRGTNPYTIFVDRFGRIARTHEGYNSGDEKAHAATIDKLLAEAGPS